MKNHLCEMLRIEHPIVAFSPNPRVVAAVTKAGGLGIFGAATSTLDEIDESLDWLDSELGGSRYGVDLLAPTPYRGASAAEQDPTELEDQIPQVHREFVAQLVTRFEIPPAKTDDVPRPFGDGGLVVSQHNLQAKLDLALARPIRLLVSALGPFDASVVARAHASDVLIGGLCGSVRHARSHVASGADIVVAQGTEAAGHTGEISTMVLVPQVVDAVAPVPVLAAGGIGSGRQLAAALALGAQGGWLGTLWLTTIESDVDQRVVEKLLATPSEGTIRTKAYTGKPTRMLRTVWEDAWEADDSPGTLPAPLQGMLVKPAIGGIYQNEVLPLMSSGAGQVVGQITERLAVSDVVESLMSDMHRTISGLSDLSEG